MGKAIIHKQNAPVDHTYCETSPSPDSGQNEIGTLTIHCKAHRSTNNVPQQYG